MLKQYLSHLYKSSYELNNSNVYEVLENTGPHKNLLDVGCWDGKQTLLWAEASHSTKIYGLEPISSAADQAKKEGINVSCIMADSTKWPFKNNTFDCIVSNQVIEHLSSVDNYFTECSRTLKSGGLLITSTNNLSSWHNIISLILGWTPFDLTNSSSKSMGLGNPLALHHGEQDIRGESWTHKCIYNPSWLISWQAVYGLSHVKTIGAGLYPLPAIVGKWLPSHSAFFTLVSRKI